MNPVEHVLVITRTLFNELGSFQGFKPTDEAYLNTFFQAGHTKFLPRPEAELDPSHKQLIPYCIFVCNGKILSYQRTKKGGESRLADKYSLGIGGHINPIDADESHDGLNAAGYLRAVAREIQEEILLQGNFTLASKGFINDESNEVGKVHLGVVHVFEITEPNVQPGEAAIGNLQFLSKEEVRALHDKLETWSQIVVDNLDEILA